MWSHFITTRTKLTQDSDLCFLCQDQKVAISSTSLPYSLLCIQNLFPYPWWTKIPTKRQVFTADSRFIVFWDMKQLFRWKYWSWINKRFLLKADIVYHTLRHRVMEGGNFEIILALGWNRTLVFLSGKKHFKCYVI